MSLYHQNTKKSKQIPWMFATPLLFAPLIPLTRILFKDPNKRRWAVGGLVATAFAHGVILMAMSTGGEAGDVKDTKH